MKKVLMVVVMLLLAAPVMANTSITAVKEGSPVSVDGKLIQTVRIDYSSDVNVRAFALEIEVNGLGSMKNIRDFNVGESNGAQPGGKSGYGIFPSRFRDFINPVGPNWTNPNYMPLVAYNEPESTNTGIGFRKWIVEMGTLFAGDANKPALSGTLFRFDVNNEADCNQFVLTVVANALRGGVVGDDAAGITGVVYNGTTINFLCCTNIPAIPACDTMTDANSLITGAGFTVGTITYEVNCACAFGRVLRADTGCYSTPHAVNYVASNGTTVPNVVGQTQAAACTLLTNANLCCGTVRHAWSDSVAAGIIMNQDTAAGICVAGGTCVTMKVSDGQIPAPSTFIYPRWDPDANVPVYWTAVAGAASYQLDRSSNNGGAWSSVYVGTATFKAESLTVGTAYRWRVLAKDTNSTSLWKTGTVDCNAYLSKCYRDGNTADGNWAQWLSVGRPDCWCRMSNAQEPNGSGYQCDGDVDGTTGGAAYRVYTLDQAAVVTNWKKTAAQITSDPNIQLAGKLKIQAACADIDHKSGGAAYRVYTLDQAIVVTNWKKTNSATSTATNRIPGNCPR